MPAAADAYCVGENEDDARWRQSGSRGEERTAWTTTCDGEKDYYGRTIDDNIDGYCIVADYRGAGSFSEAKNCKNNTWLNYSFDDSDKTSEFRMCRYDPGNGKLQDCTDYLENVGY